jgi:type II secretory pathway pseudopilin PulG
MTYCPQCGETTTPGQKFCMKCGTTLNPASANPAIPPARSNATIIFAVSALIVLLLLLAAVAVPNFIRAGREHGEATSAAGVRTLTTAQIQYQATYGQYAPDIKALGTPSGGCTQPTSANACLIDSVLANSSPTSPKSGYYYVAQLGPTPQTFVVGGIPIESHHWSFCAIEDGVVRVDVSGSSFGPTRYTACKALPPVDN